MYSHEISIPEAFPVDVVHFVTQAEYDSIEFIYPISQEYPFIRDNFIKLGDWDNEFGRINQVSIATAIMDGLGDFANNKMAEGYAYAYLGVSKSDYGNAQSEYFKNRSAEAV